MLHIYNFGGGKMNKAKIQFILGFIVALIGAVIMFEGNILGENNTGIATVIGIIGIVLIATSSYRLLK
jgi:hypothetical protein